MALAESQVEYARMGRGPAVLVSHGTLGGYDQGLAIASLFDAARHTFIAVSRAGYLRSPVSSGRTPEEQADTYAALLDGLGLETAAIIGISGGAPSALHFAQRHPNRCRALVLLSAIPYEPPPLPLFFRVVIRWQDALMGYDALWRPMARRGLPLSMRMNGVGGNYVRVALQDERKRTALEGIYGTLATASQRREGMRNDGRQIESLPADGAYTVDVPMFIAHSQDDPLANIELARRLARQLPAAHYLEMEDGGHVFFVIHSETVVPAIESFLAD